MSGLTGLTGTLKEFVNPGWVRHPSVPPLEAGLRPNDRLDAAEVLLAGLEVDDMVVHGEAVALAHGDEVRLLHAGESPRTFASLPGTVTALASDATTLYAAVRGVGVVAIGPDGGVEVHGDDARLTTCVTAMHCLPDGDLVVCVGSARYGYDEWRSSVVRRDRTGSVLLVGAAGGVTVLAERLGWPAGVCPTGDGEALVSVSNEHRIDRVTLRGGGRRTLLRNLPAFPGRITPSGDTWLVAFPYVRNRLSELLLEEPEFVEAMVASIPPGEWLLPQLRNDHPYTSALQLGQLRVLGVLKPWAPARTYGLVGVLDGRGRFASSLHSRVDGSQHGVTAAIRTEAGVLVAACGSRNLVLVKEATA